MIARRYLPRIALAFITTLCLATAAACTSDDTPDFPKVVSLGSGDIFPTILNSELAVGQNRVSMGITDRNDDRVADAVMRLRYYNLNHGTKLRAATDARYIPIALSYIDEQSNHDRTSAGTNGVYVSNIDFDESGDWGVEITIIRADKKLKPVLFRFNVLDHSTEPAIGDPAPPSVQQTIASAPAIEDIDSSFPPRPAMHNTTIADALKTGKPLVIAFATPAFCRSRTCGPVMDTVMDPLATAYAGRATFIHVEPYVLRDLREDNVQNVVPATRDWRLTTEPWIFIVDRQGRIVGKFEGIVAVDEVESVLALALETAPAAVTPVATK
jgi:hypothetical protein